MIKKNYRRKRSSRSVEIRRFAYNMGCVQRGLDNPDSLISSSYSAGKDGKYGKNRRTLY